MGTTTIAVSTETRDRLKRLGTMDESYDSVIRSLITRAYGDLRAYSVEVRLALTPQENKPDRSMLANEVFRIVNAKGGTRGVMFRGSYDFQDQQHVEDLVRFLDGVGVRDRVGMEVLRDGSAPVIRTRPVGRFTGSVRLGANGYSFAVLLNQPEEILDLAGLSGSIEEGEWRRRYLGL